MTDKFRRRRSDLLLHVLVASMGATLASWELSVAHGCTVAAVPTPEQLVDGADLVVVARADSFLDSSVIFRDDSHFFEDSAFYLSIPSTAGVDAFDVTLMPWYEYILWRIRRRPMSVLQLTITSVVKGVPPASGALHVLATSAPFLGRNLGSPPYRKARPGADGPCFAFDYRAGGSYLLLLRGGRLYYAPLAPVNEEVDGLSDAWATWVMSRVRAGTSTATSHGLP